MVRAMPGQAAPSLPIPLPKPVTKQIRYSDAPAVPVVPHIPASPVQHRPSPPLLRHPLPHRRAPPPPTRRPLPPTMATTRTRRRLATTNPLTPTDHPTTT